MLAAWHPLILLPPSPITKATDPSPPAPPLLISTTFTSDSYTVHLTDLTHLWTESLDRRGILKRSLNEETSIDPSEDAGQLRLLLEKIKGGIHGATTAGSDSLSLAIGGGRRNNGSLDTRENLAAGETLAPSILELKLRVVLPKGFEPLLWTIRVQLQSRARMAAEITIPLVSAQDRRMSELEQLLGVLKDKDHVIQKLVDKLEAVGADLGHIFPGAMGRGGRKVSKKVAEERVKGLGLFDRVDWEAQRAGAGDGAGARDIQSVVQRVFRGQDNTLNFEMANEFSEYADRWWTPLMDQECKVSMQEDGLNAVLQKKGEIVQANVSFENPGLEDDDFEVQATPPYLHNSDESKLALLTAPVATDSTDDEDGLDTPFQSQPSVIQDSFQPKRAATTVGPKRIGNIERQRPAPTSPALQEERVEPLERTAKDCHAKSQEGDDDGSATASDADDKSAATTVSNHSKLSSVSALAVPITKPKKGGLGRIGGKKHETPPIPPPEAEEASIDLPEHKPKHKLGIIGHKDRLNTPISAQKASIQTVHRDVGHANMSQNSPAAERPADNQIEPPQDRKSTSPSSPSPEESAKEKADRKREELKRELEAKAKAPPKKKRKF